MVHAMVRQRESRSRIPVSKILTASGQPDDTSSHELNQLNFPILSSAATYLLIPIGRKIAQHMNSITVITIQSERVKFFFFII